MIRKQPMFIVIGMMVSNGRTFHCPRALPSAPLLPLHYKNLGAAHDANMTVRGDKQVETRRRGTAVELRDEKRNCI
jgi:hypothetical protein